MIVIIWLTFSAVTDTVITLALVWHLVRVIYHALRQRYAHSLAIRGDIRLDFPRQMMLSTRSCAVSPCISRLKAINSLTRIAVTVQTGMITAICAIVDLIAFLASVRLSVGLTWISDTHHRSAKWITSRFQSAVVKALHELVDVQSQFQRRLEVRHWYRKGVESHKHIDQ